MDGDHERVGVAEREGKGVGKKSVASDEKHWLDFVNYTTVQSN